MTAISPVSTDTAGTETGPETATLERRPGADPLETFSAALEAIGDLATSDDRDAAFRRISDELRRLVPADTVAVLLYDPARQELSFRHAEGLPADMVESWRFGLGQGAIGAAARSGPVCCTPRGVMPDLPSDLPVRDGVECLDEGSMLPGLSSELAVPLPGRDGQVLGVLDLGSHRPAAFEAQHVSWVALLARHLGRGIESSCAHDRARRLARNLSLLQEAGRELTSILDRRKLLDRISEILDRLLDYASFSVMVWNEEEGQLEPMFTKHHVTGMDPGTVLKLGQGLCGSAAALRQPVRVGNVKLDPRYVHCSDDRVRSELVAPLVIEDRLLGVIDLESLDYDAFNEDHEQVLMTLASSIAVALENASLYERLRADEQRLDRDLTTAREVQRFLLPRRSPWVPGLQVGVANVPARHLGGDIYDFYSYGEGRTAFAIGDVAGKGTGAALYGSLVVGLLRGGYASDSQCSPPCVMAYLNDELRQLDVERRFLALAFSVYDSASRSLEIANSGLPYPWLVRGGRARELELGGLPLGATDRRDRASSTLELRPGDFVVFTTDGIDEVRDASGRAFGSDAVGELLERAAPHSDTAQDLADAILRATDRHLAATVASDDRTVLVLKVTAQ